MIEPIYETKFAPSERDDEATIQQQKSIIDNLYSIKPFLDNIPVYILILNKHRQIVFANKVFLDLMEKDSIYGMRLGESINCIHAWKEKGGCGTSEFCSECGAVNAIMNSQVSGFDSQECRITQNSNDVLDLNVWAKTINVKESEFTLFSFSDISNEKRRKVLEKIFFHDVLNTAGSLRGFIELIQEGTEDELEEFLKMTEEIASQLIDEIISQRALTQAEDGELELDTNVFSTKDILQEILLLYNNNYFTEKKDLIIEQGCSDVLIKTDRTILRRILSNLTKNALEASRERDVISLNCSEIDNKITFHINNPGYIPKNIQLQIFQRSFSTKGVGRGIGTYSIKLLTERYLNGSVAFESTEDNGTTFMVTYPKEI